MPQLSEFNNFRRDARKINAGVNSRAKTLWHGAKTNFYFRDNPSRAALLCHLIIAQFALSEEADDAKLLLHDIRLDIRKMVGVTGKIPAAHPLVESSEEEVYPREASPEQIDEPGISLQAKFSIAFTVVALPIIGIARDGFIGIALPELTALAVMSSAFWGMAKMRSVYTYLRKTRLTI